MSLTATLLALGLILKGCLRREILGAPIHALSKHILLPSAVVCFVSFLDTGAPARGGWPMLAVAGAVWLLFANSVNYGGMMLWHERWLLRHPGIPAGLLLAAAALVPIGLFGVHLSLIHLALRASSFPRGGTPVETVVAGGIAAAAGLGAGILAARLSGFWPNFAFAAAEVTPCLPGADAGVLSSFRSRWPQGRLGPRQSAFCGHRTGSRRHLVPDRCPPAIRNIHRVRVERRDSVLGTLHAARAVDLVCGRACLSRR